MGTRQQWFKPSKDRRSRWSCRGVSFNELSCGWISGKLSLSNWKKIAKGRCDYLCLSFLLPPSPSHLLSPYLNVRVRFVKLPEKPRRRIPELCEHATLNKLRTPRNVVVRPSRKMVT